MTDLSRQAPVRIWGLSDLHLNFASMPAELAFVSPANEPPWLKNARKVAKNWAETVGPNDIMLLPGDISSAKNHADVQRDLSWLSKRRFNSMVISPGNHDHWFGKMAGVSRILRKGQFGVDGTAIDLGPVIVGGARSAPVPDDPLNDKEAIDLLNKSTAKLEQSLDHVKSLQLAANKKKPVIILWHHPPFDKWGRPDRVVTIMSEAGVSACLFGHIHTQAQWQSTPQGMIQGVKFACVAADSIGFRPRLVMELGKDSNS